MTTKPIRRKIFGLFLLFLLILTSGFSCKTTDKKAEERMKDLTLNFWSVWDGPEAFDQIIEAYEDLHPFVTVNYRKFRYEEYEAELIDALAEDRGPDIFVIHNTWVDKYQNKILPLPASISLVYPVSKGAIKKEVVPELRTEQTITLKQFQEDFFEVVYDDFVRTVVDEDAKTREDKIFGIPLSIDTLAMYYNRDLLNNASISSPPAYWNRDFQQAVKKLTKQDAKGEIIQSGVALGGSANVSRYSDILAVLMMQNGTVMQDEYGNVLFDRVPAEMQGQGYEPGEEALRFYTDFSNPAKEVYSWNSKLENSIDLFAKGKLAMMFAYSYTAPELKAKAPKLNYGLAPLPQIEGSSVRHDFANYWANTVSVKTKYPNEAWSFVQFMASQEQALSYLENTGKVTALRALLDKQKTDKTIGVFAGQALTAKSWYHGADPGAMEGLMGELIDAVVLGQDKLQNLLSNYAAKVQQTVKAKKIEE